MEKERAERVLIFLYALEDRVASIADEEFTIIMERRGRAAAPAIVALMGTALAQPSTPRSNCSGISFNVRVCMEENIEGKMESELRELEPTS